MAGDWLKVEKATCDKPEIRCIARMCHVSLGDAFLAWFRLWSWLDGETETGHIGMLTPEDCDDIGRLPGIGRAVAEAGWLEFLPDGSAIVRNWDRHNSESAKKRALVNRRMAAYRGRLAERDRGAVPMSRVTAA